MKQIPPIRLEDKEYKKYFELKKQFEKESPIKLSMSAWGRHVIKKGLEIIEKEIKNKRKNR